MFITGDGLFSDALLVLTDIHTTVHGQWAGSVSSIFLHTRHLTKNDRLAVQFFTGDGLSVIVHSLTRDDQEISIVPPLSSLSACSTIVLPDRVAETEELSL